ncbi:MAG: hypothetical protein V7776_22680 [Halopseudomonas aestusnigri]
MAHKFNANHRDKFTKARYRVKNWAEYNESLRCRGDITIWVSTDIDRTGLAEPRASGGGATSIL